MTDTLLAADRMAPGTANTAEQAESLVLQPFETRWAALVAAWVRHERELRVLAPSTAWPLTAGKVLRWQRLGGRAMVLAERDRELIVSLDGTSDMGDGLNGRVAPIGYGELNPMRSRPDHWWLGHVILRPDRRGVGLGFFFTRALVREAWETCRAAKISLVVFPENTAAVECYRSAGFRMAGSEQHQFLSGESARKLLRMEMTRPTPKRRNIQTSKSRNDGRP